MAVIIIDIVLANFCVFYVLFLRMKMRMSNKPRMRISELNTKELLLSALDK